MIKAKYKLKAVTAPTLDGSVPIENNLNIPVTYEAWYEREDGLKSPKVDITVGEIPDDGKSYIFGHDMVTMFNQATDKVGEILHRKNDLLHDFDWWHCESWQDINEHLPKVIKASEQAEQPWAGGVRYGGEPGQIKAIAQMSLDSKWAFRWNGGIVIFTYMQPTNNVQGMVEELQSMGLVVGKDVHIFKNGFLPYVMPGYDEVHELDTTQVYPQFSGITSPQSADMVAWSLDNYPWSVEVPFPSENTTGHGLLNVNKALIEGSYKRKRPACTGDLAEYASDTGISRLSWAERKSNWDYILSLPLDKRPRFHNENTNDDSVENTDMARTPNRGPIDGMGCFVHWNAGYVAGGNVRHPLIEHDGASSAFNPYKLALKQRLNIPVVTEYKIFYNFVPHPRETEPLTEVPPLLANGDKAYAQAFPDSMYTKTYNQQMPAVQQAIRNYTPRFDVLVWSLKDCQIEINGQRSPVMKAGVCTWSIDLPEDYFGNIIVAIIVNGKTVLRDKSKLPRLKTCFPAMYRTSYGYSNDKARGTIQAAPVWKKTAKGLELTGSGVLMVHKGGDIAVPYDGPYKGNYPEQWFMGFKAENATYNAGPVALSPEIKF